MLDKIGRTKIFLRRILRRFINIFRFSEMWIWEYESCDRCGSCYRLPTIWDDQIWIKVNGKERGCLCPNCFLILAQSKGIMISRADFKRITHFDINGKEGNCFNIVDY